MCQPDATPTGISVRTWTISRPAIDDALCCSSVRLSLPASSSAGMVLDDMSDPPGSQALRRGDDRCGVAQEGEQLAVDLVGVRDAHDVRPAVDLHVTGAGQCG